MAWDSTRPVPWKRLLIEWAVIGVIVAAVSYFGTDNRRVESYISIVLAGFVYLGVGAVLAKLGYARKSLKQIRTETAARQAAAPAPTAVRGRPAPTRRTSTGPSNRPKKKKR
ncbi:MAG: hypothetical protein RLZ14_2079 [Actinomycetota bacterium]|jgi:hypothetical protein